MHSMSHHGRWKRPCFIDSDWFISCLEQPAGMAAYQPTSNVRYDVKREIRFQLREANSLAEEVDWGRPQFALLHNM